MKIHDFKINNERSQNVQALRYIVGSLHAIFFDFSLRFRMNWSRSAILKLKFENMFIKTSTKALCTQLSGDKYFHILVLTDHKSYQINY